jgi:long-subunit acyl-CoA synthetase (AMP-forming)
LLENIAGLYAGLLRGATVFCHAGSVLGLHGSSRFDAQQFLEHCDRLQISSCIVLPQMLHALLLQRRQDTERGGSLVFVAVGGGKVASACLSEAQRQQWPVFEGYGLTEASSVVALNTPTQQRRGSVGKKLDHITLTVENGELVIENNQGLGYLGDNGDLTSRFYTGDLGHCDDDGFVYITGRKKNMFITAFGRNVSPEWIESELNALPSIAQSFVYGEAKASNVALIVARKTPLDPAQIAEQLNALNATLPDYAQVADFMIADEPFSQHNGMLTDNGRLRRSTILQHYQQRIEQHYQHRGEQHGVF